MEFGRLAATYEALRETPRTLEKTRILAELLATLDSSLGPRVVDLVRGQVFSDWETHDLGISTRGTIAAVSKATGIEEATLEDWWREEGDLGTAAARATRNRTQQTLQTHRLTVERVHETLKALATYDGPGSQDRKIDAVAGLLTDATPREAQYIVRTVLGTMRLGIGDGIVRDAIAEAFLDGTHDAEHAVDRAYEVTNDYRVVATRARQYGIDGVESLGVQVFRPVKPMLANKAESLEAALADLADDDGVVLLEAKYDGIRAKLHHTDDTYRVFTRRLEDVTSQFPDVVTATRHCLDADEYIVEAELVGYDPETHRPVRFQDLSQRIKRRYDIHRLAEEVPVTVYVFDLLYTDGESLLDQPLRNRLERLNALIDPAPHELERANNHRTDDPETATAFYRAAIHAGHEGLMAKNLDAAYQPGARVGYQLKVKPTMEPLDLVVTRAKWSEGRKSDYLGRPYLACRDPTDGTLKEVGRMHTGFTDDDLEEFTSLVEPLIERVDGREATLTPRVVLEVSYEEIQDSPTYDSGYALRFPRFERIRHDLGPDDADTLDRIERLYTEQHA